VAIPTFFQEILKRRQVKVEAFERLVRHFGEESLETALCYGRWYDRSELKRWQAEVIYRELKARKGGYALPPEGDLPALALSVRCK
jgi:hypothetical protein